MAEKEFHSTSTVLMADGTVRRLDSFTEEDYNIGIAYLKTCYGADAYSNEELIAAF